MQRDMEHGQHGELLGAEGHGYLISDAQYRNCELKTYVRSSPLANGGIFFRWITGKGAGSRSKSKSFQTATIQLAVSTAMYAPNKCRFSQASGYSFRSF